MTRKNMDDAFNNTYLNEAEIHKLNEIRPELELTFSSPLLHPRYTENLRAILYKDLELLSEQSQFEWTIPSVNQREN